MWKLMRWWDQMWQIKTGCDTTAGLFYISTAWYRHNIHTQCTKTRSNSAGCLFTDTHKWRNAAFTLFECAVAGTPHVYWFKWEKYVKECGWRLVAKFLQRKTNGILTTSAKRSTFTPAALVFLYNVTLYILYCRKHAERREIFKCSAFTLSEYIY